VLAAIVTLVIGAVVVAFPASRAVAWNGPSVGCRTFSPRAISLYDAVRWANVEGFGEFSSVRPDAAHMSSSDRI
jgi:hypothetical protein